MLALYLQTCKLSQRVAELNGATFKARKARPSSVAQNFQLADGTTALRRASGCAGEEGRNRLSVVEIMPLLQGCGEMNEQFWMAMLTVSGRELQLSGCVLYVPTIPLELAGCSVVRCPFYA
ncbi:MAG: hypothetical protein ACLTSZ_13295 [Lachnospiraceae bacterium]